MTIELEFSAWARVLLAVLGIGIMFSCLCRAKWMSLGGTANAIRWATTALASAGCVLLVVALLRPDWVLGALLCLSAAALAVQVVSARYWRRGQPAQFTRGTRHG
jgi:hypothetical protein